jgi:hypothetical protein
MRVSTDQTQKIDIIRMELLLHDIMTGAVNVMIICDDEQTIVNQIIDDWI